VRREPDFLVAFNIRSAVPNLRPPDLEGADPGLDLALGTVSVPNDALPAVRQSLLGELADEGLYLGFERAREHPARTFPGDLGERVLDRSQLTELDDAGIFLHGVSLLLEVLAGFDTRHDTPPSQLASPKFSHSSPSNSADRSGW
jgi:hypothetical protein